LAGKTLFEPYYTAGHCLITHDRNGMLMH